MVMASSPWPLSAISKSKIAVDEAKMTTNVALALPARTRATAPASSAALQPRIRQLAGHRALCPGTSRLALGSWIVRQCHAPLLGQTRCATPTMLHPSART